MTETVGFDGAQALLAIDTAIDPVFVVRACRRGDDIVDFEFRYLNRAAQAFLAPVDREMVGRRVLREFPSLERLGIVGRWVRCIATQQPDRYRLVDFEEGGIHASMEINAVPIGDDLVLSGRDESSKVEVERALARSEARYRSLIQHAGDVHLVIDAVGTLTLASPAVERVLGYPPASVLGQSAFDFLHPEDLPVALESMADILEHPGVAAATTYRVRHADGSWRWMEDVANNLLDDPLVQGIVLTLRDITGQRESAAELEEVNRVLRTVTAADVAVVRAGSEDELVLEMCRVIVETGGYPLAWIAVPDPDDPGRIVPAAVHGGVPGFHDRVLSSYDGPIAHGPATTAIASGATVLLDDVRTLPVGVPLREISMEHGYLTELALPLSVGGRVIGALAIHAHEAGSFDADEIRLFEQLAQNLAFGIASRRTAAERQHYLDRLEGNLEALIGTVAAVVEARDPYTAGHQRRVAGLARAIARDLGLPEDDVRGIEVASEIHDLGKITIPSEILTKPGKLTPIEFELIKGHVQAGYDLVQGVDFPWPVARMILEHHERLDGSGYPLGLRGDQILRGSQIIAVADVVEAMVTHRPYRAGKGIDAALAQIESERGTRLAADAVDACVSLFRDGRFVLQGV